MRSALVLVASSDPIRRAAIIRAAAQSGHRVLEAIDGLDAVTAAARYIPDLLIADAVLPQFDGPQVANMLEENPDTTDVSVILIGTATAVPNSPDPTRVVVEPSADVTGVMAALLSRRTTTGDGIVML